MDPDRPDEIYCENVLWKIDFEKRTWKPVSTHWRPTDPNSPSSEGCSYGGFKPLTAKNGKQYAWASNYAKGNCLFIREGDVFKPYLLLFRSTNDHEPTPWPAFPLMGDIKQYPNGRYIWVDRNADGLLQREEITKQDNFDFHWVDKDLNLWSAAGAVYRPVRIEPDGRPVYDFAKVERLPLTGAASMYPIVVDAQVARCSRWRRASMPAWLTTRPAGSCCGAIAGRSVGPRRSASPPPSPASSGARPV